MQVYTSLQTDNHASTPPLSFFTGRMTFLPPNQQRQSTEGNGKKSLNSLLNTDIVPNLRQISMTKIFPRHFHDIWPIPCYLARFSRQASLCEEVTRYKQSHNLVGSLNDVMQPHVPVILLYRKLLQIAVATKHLQRLHAHTGLHRSS